MQQVTVQSRIPNELKFQTEEVFQSMGLSMADGIRLFLNQVANTGQLPFQPIARQPNQQTLMAFKQTLDGKTEKTNLASLKDQFGL